MGRTVTARVPATSANLGSGFDALGLALDLAGEVSLCWRDHAPPPARDKAAQIILAAARALFARAGSPPLSLEARYAGAIPPGRGLGASAVLRVGALVAANRLLNDHLAPHEIAVLAAELEGHADNATAALFGGLQVVVWDNGRLTHVAVPLPGGLHAALLVPEFEMPTVQARRLLPAEVPLRDAVHNVGRAALLVAALAAGKLDVLSIATQDVLHQPARAAMFPGLHDVIAAALDAGALCAYLSGAGSTVAALTLDDPRRSGDAMLASLRSAGGNGRLLYACPSTVGATIVRDDLGT